MKREPAEEKPQITDVDFKRRQFLKWTSGCTVTLVCGGTLMSVTSCGGRAGTTTPRLFSDNLVINYPQEIKIPIEKRMVQWVPGVNPVQPNAWVYTVQGTSAPTGVLPNHLGPFINVRRNVPCSITWLNTIAQSSSEPGTLELPPDNTPLVTGICGNVRIQSDIGLVSHMHGARVQGSSDGWPLAPMSFEGNPYGFPTSRQYHYENAQRSTMLWYHDHAMDRTGRHVQAGLAGLYFIRDTNDDAILALAGGKRQELPFVIQDHILTSDQSAIDYAAGMPDTNTLFRPEFLGTTLFVNGHPGTAVTLTRRTWRLRILNASNARTYALALCDPDTIQAKSGQVWQSQCMRIIGTDGGLLGTSVQLESTDVMVIAPGQRRDVLFDFSLLPSSVQQLRLVNLNIKFLLESDSTSAEAIYTTFDDSVLAPSDANYQSTDNALYAALDLPLANVTQIALSYPTQTDNNPVGPISPSVDAIEAVLSGAANEDDFIWDGKQFGPRAGIPFGENRLVLLVSNTEGLGLTDAVNGVSGWSDVQIFEMQAGGSDWQIPFDVDLGTIVNPGAGKPSLARSYQLARRRFFASERNPDITVANKYPDLHAPTINSKGGTYERWYVANIGNTQPLCAADGSWPDMHPFHIHLVNFVVTKRWQLDGSTPGILNVMTPDALDGIAREDTVIIASNQIIELLVYIPPGYSGNYAYHCHLLEHEDMCMMSHFSVTP